MKTDVAKLLLDIKAVDLNAKEGFLYASGRRGPIYCDNRMILSYVHERNVIIDAFVRMINEKGFEYDAIAGVATGAIAWGALVADRLNKPFAYIRSASKDHGKGNLIEGRLEEGQNVLIIEDLINTGGSSVSACLAVKEAGCNVVGCIAIFSYQLLEAEEKFVDEKLSLFSLTGFRELVKAAIESDYIKPEDEQTLIEWQADPKAWKPKTIAQ